MEKAEIAATLETLGLTVESRFIPFSQSRNKDDERKTLNWSVTVKRNGRDILTTDYSAGAAHCPGYAAKKAPSAFVPRMYRRSDGTTRYASERESMEQYREAVCAAECESGMPMEIDPFSRGSDNTFKRKHKAPAILPDPVDVLYSLAMDSSVLDAGGFENWAGEYGYDTDSRKAESIYRACLDIALKLRAALGDTGMETLRNAFEDY